MSAHAPSPPSALPPPAQVRRILFITATRIGDAVMSTGVLNALVEMYPAAQFTIACGPLAQSLFAAVPRLERIIVVRKQPLDWHWVALWREVRPIAWDLVVDLRRSLLSYFLNARARRVLGPDDPGQPRVATLPRVLGLDAPLDPRLFTFPHHDADALRLIPPGPPVLGVGPVASLSEKTWAGQRFMALVRLLTAPGGRCAGWRVAAFGGPDDDTVTAQVLDAVAPTARLAVVGEPDLLTVYASLKRCTAFVGNDSGLSHLAAAAGVPTLAVFGATDPGRYAPWGGRAVQGPARDLASLAPEMVADALAEMLTTDARRASREQRG